MMSTTTNQTTSVPSAPKRIILASAYRHERRSTGRQERALRTLRKMGRFDDAEMLDGRRVHHISSADESLDD
jgi:hypothetical protein